MRFLIPCDGSEQSLRALAHMIRLAATHATPEVHLLNVRASADAWQVRSFLIEEEIASIQRDEGDADLRDARDLLDRAGITYSTHVATGPVAETIAAFAVERGCDHIVMGTHGHGGLVTLLLGSVAAAVVRLSTVPVTLVK